MREERLTGGEGREGRAGKKGADDLIIKKRRRGEGKRGRVGSLFGALVRGALVREKKRVLRAYYCSML